MCAVIAQSANWLPFCQNGIFLLDYKTVSDFFLNELLLFSKLSILILKQLDAVLVQIANWL